MFERPAKQSDGGTRRPLFWGAGLSALLHGGIVLVAGIAAVTMWSNAHDDETGNPPQTQTAKPGGSSPRSIQAPTDQRPAAAAATNEVRPRAIGDTGFEAIVVYENPPQRPSGRVLTGNIRGSSSNPVVAAAGDGQLAATSVARPEASAEDAEAGPTLDNPRPILDAMTGAHAAAARAARGMAARLDREDAPRWLDGASGRQRLAETATTYRLGAAHGRSFAHYNLALAHLHGRGVEADAGRAADLLERGAHAGHAPSMLRLAELHLAGVGRTRSAVAAAAWYRVAAGIGSRAGRLGANLLDAHLDVEVRAAARKRAIDLQDSLSLDRPQDWSALDAAIRAAAERGDEAEVLRLLEAGGDADSADSDGRSGLISAAWRGHAGIAELLIVAGVDPDRADNKGRNALMWASINGYPKLVGVLADRVASVDARDQDGLTPLMRAAWNGHEHVVKVLLSVGANTRLRDETGASALDRARLSGNPAVEKLLRSSAPDE